MLNSLFTTDKPDFERARLLAYELLLEQENPKIGMNAEDIMTKNKNIYIDTFQNYNKLTNVSMDSFKANGTMPLGITICIDRNVFLILNDNKKSACCRNWANLHEMGHIYLGHTNNGDKEEVEAHFFAACFLMPDPVVKKFNQFGFNTDEKFLEKYFNASSEAAKRKIKTMKQYNYPSKYDADILNLLYNDIDRITDDILDERFIFAFQ